VSAIRQVIDDGTDMYGVEVELSTLSILQMEVKFLHPLCNGRIFSTYKDLDYISKVVPWKIALLQYEKSYRIEIHWTVN
jgi:hypothetical protein